MPNLLRDASTLALHFSDALNMLFAFCFFMLFGWLKTNPLRWTSILILSNTENGWTHKFPTALGGELGWLTLGAPTSRLHTSRYGALGVMNDFRGVTSAYGYGDSYLVTKLPCFHQFFFRGVLEGKRREPENEICTLPETNIATEHWPLKRRSPLEATIF